MQILSQAKRTNTDRSNDQVHMVPPPSSECRSRFSTDTAKFGMYARCVDPSPDVEAAARAVMANVASIEITELAGGSSAFVALLHLRSDSGELRTAVFRQHIDKVGKGHQAGVAAKEFVLTNALRSCGVEVPAPLGLHDGECADGPWLVSEFVAGRNAIGMMTNESLVDEMAGVLARIHGLEPSLFAAASLEPIENPVLSVPRYLADDDLGERVRAALDGHLMRGSNKSRLLHGDFWPGNVMVRNENLEAVLDWEDAKLGDPLVDVACARVEITCDGGSGPAEQFTKSYCKARPDVTLEDLAVWDIYVSATALSGVHLWGLAPEAETMRREATATFLTDATQRLAG